MDDSSHSLIRLPATETAAFVAHAIGSRINILDIGCGVGLVAEELVKRGKHVTGIDTNEERIAEARKRDIDAHVSAWPGFETDRQDAVLFAASLHHMSDVDAALGMAGSILTESGMVLADEFACEGMDTHTAEWLADRVCEGVASGCVRSGADPLLDALLAGEDPLRAWNADHLEHVTPSSRMIAAAESAFQRVEVNGCPYLYRYLVAASTASASTAEWFDGLLQKEAEAIEAGLIAAIGCRMVMTEPSA